VINQPVLSGRALLFYCTTTLLCMMALFTDTLYVLQLRKAWHTVRLLVMAKEQGRGDVWNILLLLIRYNKEFSALGTKMDLH